MKRLLLHCCLLLLFCKHAICQLTVTGGFTAQQLADNLAGPGISVTNAVVSGAAISYGTFSASNTNLGLSSGIMLTSGSRDNTVGPNVNSGISFNNGTPGDTQLTALAGAQTYDATVLEFDFTVETDQIQFKYVFGSDEYLEFVGSFNDVFAFYISGPGIAGQQNIALVPGTTSYVSINNINTTSYWQYYVDNPNGTTLEYDGITVVLTAKKSGLIPCETYHLKLAVADALDDALDTGVFLEENSLVQGSISAVSNTALGDSVAVEGCKQASFTFSLSNPVPYPSNIPLKVKGSAVNGIDYAFIDSIFTIPAGQTSATIFIKASIDGLTEGQESVLLYYKPEPCVPFDSVLLYIKDNVPITFTATGNDADCYGDSTGSISLNITGGTPPFSIVLNGADTFQTSTIPNLPAGIYGIKVLDGYGCGGGALAAGGQYAGQPLFLPDGNGNIYTTPITISGFPVGTTLTNAAQLQFVSVSLEHSFIGDVGIRLYAPNGAFVQLKERPGGNHTNFGEPVAKGPVDTNNPDSTMGVCYPYFFTNSPQYGTMVNTAGNYTYSYIPVTGPPIQNDKFLPSGSYQPYQPFSNLVGAPLNGTWSIWIKDYKPQDNGWVCNWSLSFSMNAAGDTVIIGQPGKINLSATVNNPNCGNSNGSVNLTTTGNFAPFTWLWSNGATTEDINSLSPGIYTVTSTDSTGCDFDSSFFVQNNNSGFTTSVSAAAVSCPGGSNGNVNLTVTGAGSPWTYLWSNGASTQDLLNVPAGMYSVTVTGANGCVQLNSIQVNTIPGIVSSAVISNEVCGQLDGSIDLSVTSGNPPYSFSWNNSTTNEDQVFLQAGNYSVIITDNGGCTMADTFAILNNVGNCQVNCNLSSGTAVVTDETCGNGNGSLNITPSGGYAPLAYVWSNSSFTEDIYSLAAGTYFVTITDAQGCTSSSVYTIFNQAGTLTAGTPLIGSETCGNGKGSIDISPAGGTLPYFYSWSNSAVSQDISTLNAGNYTVTITDATGCGINETYTVYNNTGTMQQTWGNPLGETCGNGLGSIDITIMGGMQPHTFNWSNGEVFEDLDSLSAGTYSCLIVDFAGCSLSTPVYTVTNDPGTLSLDMVLADNEICSGANGKIRLIVSGGSKPYSFLWNNGATADTNSNLAAGNYSATVADAAGCSFATGQITLVNEPGQLSLGGIDVTNEVCGNGMGVLNLSASSPAVPLTYQWSNGSTSEDLYVLSSGTYYITIIDTSGCTLSSQATVANDPGAIIILNMVVTNEFCADSSGAIDLFLTGITAPAVFTWSNGATTEDISSLWAGNYSVTVQDATGCSVSGSATVGNNSGNLQLTGNIVSHAACGKNDGSIDLSVTGNAPVQYLWSNGATGQDLVNLSPGNYSCKITDGLFCSIVAGPFVIQNSSGTLQITNSNVTDELCGNSAGSIDITVAGGSGFYYYSWSNAAITEDIMGLADGNYNVNVSDGQGCIVSSSFAVADDPGSLSITSIAVADEICGGGNGGIDISVTGGTGFTYLWNNGAATQDIAGLATGNYNCTVTSGGCKTNTGIVAVSSNPGSLSLVQIFSVDENCGNGLGEVTLSVSGGISPVSYLWNTGDTTIQLTNLNSGVYTVTVSDSAGCEFSASSVVKNSSGSLTISGDTISDETCANGSGSILIGTGGGTSPVSFLWNNGSATKNVTGIPAGNYTLLIGDSAGCQLTWTGTVKNQGGNLKVTAIQVFDALCGGGGGSLDITVAGGTLPYGFAWSNGDTAEDPGGLSPGNYQVSIADGLGCTSSASAVVGLSSGSLFVTPSVTDETCGQGNGSISLAVNGLNLPFSFAWSNGDTTQSIGGLIAGTYSVIVTDASGCSDTTISVVGNLGNGIAIANPVITHENCGNNAGAIDITVSGGSNPYMYLWSNGATTQDLSGISAGNYSVTVSDISGCAITSPVYSVNNNTGTLAASASITDEECGNAGGAIDLIPSGGAGTYQYSWSTGAIAQDINGLSGGNYSVTITDSTGCQLNLVFAVASGQGDVSVDSWIITASSCQTNNGTIDITVSSSFLPCTFLWSNGSTTEDITNISAGNYSVTITDANNCIAIQSFVVPASNSISIQSVTVFDDWCDGGMGQIEVIASGGTGQLQYSLNSGIPQPFGTFWGLFAGLYNIDITDSLGCSLSTTATVNSQGTLTISPDSIVPASCPGCQDGAVYLTVTGSAPPFSFFWSDGSSNQNLQNVLPGTYDVWVSDVNFCSKSDTFIVGFSVGIPDSPPSWFELYPNPNSGVFAVRYSLPGIEEGDLEIRNLTGVLVHEQKVRAGKNMESTISFPDVTDGVYIVTLKSDDFGEVRKVIVRQ